eukprot:jgi/Ulvmu1/9157/UM005_0255.1
MACRKEASSATQWNTASLPNLMSSSRRIRVFPERALLEEELAAHHMRCIWAAQILTDVAIESHTHDSCALLQMPPEGVPGLADVVQQLLSAFAVMDQYLENTMRTVSGKKHRPLLAQLVCAPPKPGTAGVEAQAVTVHACLDQCLHRLQARFGPGLASLRQRASMVPAVVNVKLDGFSAAILGG